MPKHHWLLIPLLTLCACTTREAAMFPAVPSQDAPPLPPKMSKIPGNQMLVTIAENDGASWTYHQTMISRHLPVSFTIDTRQTIPKDGQLIKAGGILFEGKMRQSSSQPEMLYLNFNAEHTTVVFKAFHNGATGDHANIAYLPQIDTMSTRREDLLKPGIWVDIAGSISTSTTTTADGKTVTTQKGTLLLMRVDVGHSIVDDLHATDASAPKP